MAKRVVQSLFGHLTAAYKGLIFNYPGQEGNSSDIVASADFWGNGPEFETDHSDGGQREYVRRAGKPTSHALIMAAVNWLGRTLPEAPLQVLQTDERGNKIPIVGHPMLRLWKRPNPYFTGSDLWKAFAINWIINGNVYFKKVRNLLGKPIELWWMPADRITPVWDKNDPESFLTGYEYKVGNAKKFIPHGDVIHFKNGCDPQNERLGLSPIASLFRELATDTEAGIYANALMRNYGVPPIIVSPASAEGQIEDPDDVKRKIMASAAGNRAGNNVVLSGAVKIDKLPFEPDKLAVEAVRRLPEERVASVIGINGIVLGFGASWQHCLPATAKISTPHGLVAMRDLKEGDVVWSLVGNELKPRKVLRKWPTGTKLLYEVRTGNRVLTATDNHPVLTRVPGSLGGGGNDSRRVKIDWKRIDELRVRDQIVIPDSFPDQKGTVLPTGEPATNSFMKFLGALVGDGTVTPGFNVRMAIPKTDRVADQYRAFARENFYCYVSHPYNGNQHEKFPSLTRHDVALRSSGFDPSSPYLAPMADIAIGPVRPVRLTEHINSFAFQSTVESRRLAALGFAGRSHTKRVPGWIYGLSRELRLNFLAGIVDTDGTVDRYGRLAVRLCNRELVEDIKELLVSVGIPSSNLLYIRVPAGALPCKGNKDYYDCWAIQTSNATLTAQIPVEDQLYKDRWATVDGQGRIEKGDVHKVGLGSGFAFSRIRSITVKDRQPVWDIEVEGGHSFIADGVVVHNSIYNTVSEAREEALECYLLPLMTTLSNDFDIKLLNEWETDTFLTCTHFDKSDLRVLLDDRLKEVKLAVSGYTGGLLTRNEARGRIGEESIDGQDAFIPDAKATADIAQPGIKSLDNSLRDYTPEQGAKLRRLFGERVN